jgi:hypothetical protein
MAVNNDVRTMDEVATGLMGDLRLLHDLISHTAEILVRLQQRNDLITDVGAFPIRDGYDPRTRPRGRCWRCR